MDRSKEMARIAYEALEDAKGEDIRVIGIGDISSIADFFVISNGTNASQVDTMVENVEKALSKKGYKPIRVEGIRTASWVLMDYGDIVVHIFSEEDRLFYNLEKIWKEGEVLDKEQLD